MEIIATLFNSARTIESGDIILKKNSSFTFVATNNDLNYLNAYRSQYSICPFNFNGSVVLEKDQIELIKTAYNLLSDALKRKYKDEINFIMNIRVINQNLYNFYNDIKNLEFIPKDTHHLLELYNCVKKLP